MSNRDDINDWDDAQDDDGLDDDGNPEDLADPGCVECGGQGGFLTGPNETWVWCHCVDEL